MYGTMVNVYVTRPEAIVMKHRLLFSQREFSYILLVLKFTLKQQQQP